MARDRPFDHAGAMTTTPPEAPHDGAAPGADEGPRVTGPEARDLSRLSRTVGPYRYLGGVAGGLARHFDVDPLLIRVAFVILTLFGGAGLIVYVGCWLLLPEDGVGRRRCSSTPRPARWPSSCSPRWEWCWCSARRSATGWAGRWPWPRS